MDPSLRPRAYVALLLLASITLATGSASVAGFRESKWVNRDVDQYEKTCLQGRQGEGMRQLEASYKSLRRVLVVDAIDSKMNSGIDDLLRDYITWFSWAAVSERALFIRWVDCNKDPTKCGMFNLGDWFLGNNNTDWTWSSEIEARLKASGVAATLIYLQADKEKPTELTELLRSDAPWVTVQIHDGVGLLPTPQASADQNGSSQGESFEEVLVAQAYKALFHKFETTLKSADDQQALEESAYGFALAEATRGVHLRGCLLHWALRPRPILQAALMPALKGLDDKRGVAVLYIQSGYAEFEALGFPEASTEDSFGFQSRWVDRNTWHVGSARERWARLNHVMADGGLAHQNDDRVLSRCGAEQEGWTLGEAGDSRLQPYFTCAARAARAAARERQPAEAGPKEERGDWAVYLASDVPVVLQLAPLLDGLQGHLVHGCAAHDPGHCHQLLAAHERLEHHGRARGRQPHGLRDASARQLHSKELAHLQLAADSWMLGLADRLVTATEAAFPASLAARTLGRAGPPLSLAEGAPAREAALSHVPFCEGLKLEFGSEPCKAAYKMLLEAGHPVSMQQPPHDGSAPPPQDQALSDPDNPVPVSEPDAPGPVPATTAPVEDAAEAVPEAAADEAGARAAAGSAPFEPPWSTHTCVPLQTTVKVHIYPNSSLAYSHFYNGRHIGDLLKRVRADAAVFVEDPAQADFFVVQYNEPEDLHAVADKLVRQQAFVAHLLHVQNTWPYLNQSIARNEPNHIIFFLGDHGPGDSWYSRHEERGTFFCPNAAVPNAFNPACHDRALIFAMFPGSNDWRRLNQFDGELAGHETCVVCFQKGKDIRLPSGDFDRMDLWEDAEEESMLTWSAYNRAQRPTMFAFRGVLPPVNPQHGIFWEDLTGRSQLWGFVDEPAYAIGEYEEGSDAEVMRHSVFCYNPLGRGGGDSLRYVTATMFGCITVWIANDGAVARPYEEVVPWDRMSITVPLQNIKALPAFIANVTEEEYEPMFQAMKQYWSYLFWGEGFFTRAAKALAGRPDSYHGFIGVLQHRLNARRNGSSHVRCGQ